jgi:hypothetical protein
MAKDGRDILEVLQAELDFIEKEGYKLSDRTPWLSKSIFQDSMTCLNYGYPYRAHPCSDCHLLDFVATEDFKTLVPCHYIPLNRAGETIEELESKGDEARALNLVKTWLRTQIDHIWAERSRTFWQMVD